VSSRRKAETLIQAGKVQVNGQTITRLGTTADPRRDTIVVDGQPVSFDSARLYFVLNKPTGVVSTLADPEGRTTVRELLGGVRERVFPVGRLDYHSAGLLLLTNDGELTARLLHPRYQIPRTYHAKLTGACSPHVLSRLKNGVRLTDGRLSGPAEIRTIRRNERKTWIEITLGEGRHHEVRQMCDAIGYPVEKLIRVRFGPLLLTELALGAYRPLAPIEVQALKRAVGLASGSK
jgi:23S rRNA pseudouridine2605 synthase